ncbi:FUSC family protein [Nonomuraea sp. NPDC003214]
MGRHPAHDHRQPGSRPAQALRAAAGWPRRAWDLLRPEGRPDVPVGVAAGASIMLPLLAGAWLDRPGSGPGVGTGFGAAMSLATTLMLMPAAFPLPRLMLVRGVEVTAAGVCAWLTGAHPWLLAAAVTAAAVAGALWPVLGTTGALATLFVAIMGGADVVGVPGVAQAAGAVWGALVALLLGRLSGGGSPRPEPGGSRLRHAARLGVLVGAAMTLVASLGLRVAEGHWLVTSILNTMRPTPEATGTRYAKRMLGSLAGGALAALILIGHPSTLVTALCVGAAGALAHAYRAANYAYWAIWMPVMLLLLSDFSRPEPWTASLARTAMNLLGGLAALMATRWLWPGRRDA